MNAHGSMCACVCVCGGGGGEEGRERGEGRRRGRERERERESGVGGGGGGGDTHTINKFTIISVQSVQSTQKQFYSSLVYKYARTHTHTHTHTHNYTSFKVTSDGIKRALHTCTQTLTATILWAYVMTNTIQLTSRYELDL